jgi:predicted DNA binding CopG/RHH family protein
MADKRVIPKFKSEAEEAEWWDQNRDMISQDLRAAQGAGELKVLTKERLRERLNAKARVVTIRLAEADIDLARKQAERKGLPYQTYIRSLLHETLVGREGKLTE